MDVHLRQLRQQYFDAHATQIQRTWRGHYSRKHLHNFYTRKAFLEEAKRANLDAQSWLQSEYMSCAAEQNEQAIQAARSAFDRRIHSLHHLVSTASQPGVFNSPYSAVTGTTPHVDGVPLETHFKAAWRRNLRLPPVKSPASKSQLSTGSAVKPRSGFPLSLQATSTYDGARNSDHLDRALDRAHQFQMHGAEFSTAVQHTHPYHELQSNRNLEQYRGVYDPTAGERSQRFDSRMRTVSDRPFFKYWRQQDEFAATLP